MKLIFTLPAARSLTSLVNIALVRSSTVPTASEPPNTSAGCARATLNVGIAAPSATAPARPLIRDLLIVSSSSSSNGTARAARGPAMAGRL
jgi:hypothetical protein